MQKDQKMKVSSKAEVFSQCSCPECDSASCFVKRRAMDHCTCVRLAAPELHTYSSQSSKLVTETKHSISKSPILTEEHIVHDLKKKHIKSSISEVTQQIISEFMKESNKNHFTNSTTTIFKTSNTSFKQKQGNSRKTSSFNKDSREESKKDKASNVYCYRKKAYREGSESLPKDGACQNMSAAVDHSMLNQELQAPIPKTKISSAIVNLSAVDIYNKIKEAYKACSCEVCKCVVGKSLQSKFCECKPCECHNCANLSKCMLNYIGTEVIQKHDEECFCVLCDKKSCKVLEDSERKLQEYHGHHEELKLRKRGKDCDCKRCECIKCKARSIHRTLIVAPVGGELQHRNGCQCAPCECFECRHRYGVNTNGQHEISTGVNRHPNCQCEVCDNEACIPDNNQSCRCVRQSKVMSKPVERDSQDYDIHTAHVTYNNKGICEGNFETLAMFAALPSSYTKRLDQSKQCSCDHCECLSCEYSDRNNLSPNAYQLDRELHGKINYKPEVLEQFKLEDRHFVDKCKCIDCDNSDNSGVEDENATKKLNKKCSSNHVCNCNICKMIEHENTETDYFKNRGEDASVDLIRLMKSRRQTRLRNKDPLIQTCINTLESNKKIFQHHELSFHASKSSTSIDNFVESHHPTCRQVCYGSHRIFCSDLETDSGVHEHVSECANEIDLRKHNKQTLNSSLSLLSSKSFVKESESVTHVMSKLKSRESSCNSSGYDYPDYLAHFPKLTIKTCLDDVMQCNLSNNQVFNMGSNHNIVTKSTHFNLRDQKSFRSQVSSARSSKNTKVNRKVSQTFDIQNYINQIRNFTKETRKTNTLSKCTMNAENEIDKFKTDSSSTSTTNTSAKVAFNEEYIRVQKTLRDAREYSQHLVSLFEKYEKANKEFESVSERIKNSKNSIDRNINTFVVQEVPTKDSECTFTSAFDEIDTINKQENYIDLDNFNSSEPVNILKNAIFANHDVGNLDDAFTDTNHTFITEEKDTKDVNKQKMRIDKKLDKRLIQVTERTQDTKDVNKQKMRIDKKLDKRLIQVTERTQDVVTPQRCISQPSKIDDKQDVLILNNDSVIVLISDSQPLGNQRNFQKFLDTKVIDTGKNADRDCHDKSNIDQANNSEKLGLEKNIKTIEERKGIIAKRDFHHIISTTLSKNTNLSTKCTAELINLTKSKSTVKIKTESKLLLENLYSPKTDMNMNSDNVKHPSCFIVLPPPHASDGKAATEVTSQRPVDKHATYVNKSKSLKSNNIVHATTESSKLLLENLDKDQNFSKVKHEDVVSLPHETDEKAATEMMSDQPVDEHYVDTSKALEVLQTEVKRILDLPFLQVVKHQSKRNGLSLKKPSKAGQEGKSQRAIQPAYPHKNNWSFEPDKKMPNLRSRSLRSRPGREEEGSEETPGTSTVTSEESETTPAPPTASANSAPGIPLGQTTRASSADANPAPGIPLGQTTRAAPPAVLSAAALGRTRAITAAATRTPAPPTASANSAPGIPLGQTTRASSAGANPAPGIPLGQTTRAAPPAVLSAAALGRTTAAAAAVATATSTPSTTSTMRPAPLMQAAPPVAPANSAPGIPLGQTTRAPAATTPSAPTEYPAPPAAAAATARVPTARTTTATPAASAVPTAPRSFVARSQSRRSERMALIELQRKKLEEAQLATALAQSEYELALECASEVASEDIDNSIQVERWVEDTTKMETPCPPIEEEVQPPPQPEKYLPQLPPPEKKEESSLNLIRELADAITLRNCESTRNFWPLPDFDGTAEEWLPFVKTYEESAAAHTNSQNTARLRKALKGVAKEAVRSLLYAADNPGIIMKTLERRFGRPDDIVDMELQKLKALSKPGDNPRDVIIFASRLSNAVATIKALKKPFLLHSPEVGKTVIDKLSALMRYRWYDFSTATTEEEPILEKLERFLNREADICGSAALPEKLQRKGRQTVSASLEEDEQAANTTTVPSCRMCEGTHYIEDCAKFEKATVDARWEIARDKKLCFKCLRGRHSGFSCRTRPCVKCKRPHHLLLHNERPAAPQQQENEDVAEKTEPAEMKDVVTNVYAATVGTRAYLKIVPVDLYGPEGSTRVLALLDEGSTVTLLEARIAEKIGATGEEEKLVLQTVGGKVTKCDSQRMDLPLKGAHRRDRHTLRGVCTVKDLRLSPQHIDEDILESCSHLREIKEELFYSSERPALLIGQDNWDLIISRKVLKGKPNEPVASLTSLGWVLHGRASRAAEAVNFLYHCRLAEEENTEEMTKRHINLEANSIQLQQPSNEADSRALAVLEKTTEQPREGSSKSGLLLKSDGESLPFNYKQAYNRLVGIEKKLQKDATQETDQSQIENLLNSDTQNRKFNLPHLAVVQKKKIRIREEDRGSLRFLWRYETAAQPKELGMKSVIFGAASSPSAAIFVTNKNAETFPRATKSLLIGRSCGAAILGAFDVRTLVGTPSWRTAQHLADHFWARWPREYLPTFRPRAMKSRQTAPELKQEDVVIIADSTFPRNNWPRGVVEAAYPGRYGRLRFVDVRTRGDVVPRPVSRLILIALSPKNGVPGEPGTRGETVDNAY